MSLYQNFTTSSSGTITIPGPIIGTHTSNTIANIFTVNGKVGIGTTTPSGTFDVNGNVSMYGNSNTLGNLFTTGGNIGIGTTTPESRFQVVLPTNVDVSWRNLTFRGTSLWGDGITTYNGAGVYTSGTLYGTLMNVMLCNPHIVSNFGSTAQIRFGKAGGINTGAYWETGVKTDGSWHIGQSGITNNFIITTGGSLLLNAGSPEYFTNRFVIRDNATGNTAAQLLIQGSSDTRKTMHIGYDTTNNYAFIDSLNHNVAWTNTIFCRNGGNVGIGTTNSSYKLDVSGDIRMTNAYITGGVLYPNTSSTTATNFQINVFGGTLTVNGPTNYSGYGINAAGTSTLGNLISVASGNVGVGNAAPSFKLDVNGDFRAYGGRYIIQNGQDGGTGRGIYMWTEGDTNWAIYMSQSGAGRSFSAGTATTGVYGFSSFATRFRINNSTDQGFIFENSSEQQLVSIRGDGHMYVAGNLGIGQVSPSYKLHVNGDTITNGWFRTSGDTGLWSETHSRGIRPAILGDYGNIETHGIGKNQWEGYSIEGRYVFMSSDNNQCGIFNDIDNQWIMYYDRSDVNNKYVQLKHNDNTRLQTTSAGIYVNGEVDIQGTNVIELGVGLTKEANAGKIGYNTFDSGALDIIGAGTSNRTVRIWDTLKIGGWTMNANDGHLRFYYNGTQTYVMHNTGEFWSSASGYYHTTFVKVDTTLRIRARKANEYLQAGDAWDARTSSNAGSWEEWYIQYSDRRLKSNIVTLEPTVKERLISLKPVNFNWISSNRDDFGFIAQEVFELFPKLRPPIEEMYDISHPDFSYDNPIDKDGNPIFYTLDYGKLTPYIIQTIKELDQELQTSKNDLEITKSELQSTKKTVELLNEQNKMLIQEIQKIKEKLGLE